MDDIWSSLIKHSNYTDEVITWRSLKKTNMFTLLRIFEQTKFSQIDLLYGFTYNQLKSIPYYAIKDARNIGPGRLKQLIDELNLIFSQHLDQALSINNDPQPEYSEPELIEENNIYQELINAKTLSDFDKYFLESLQLFVFPEERTLEIILHRVDWSPKPKQTLEEIGMRLGITRERVRQIERKHKSTSYPILDEINILQLINHIFITSSSIEEYIDQLNEFEPTYDLNRSPFRFVSLAYFLCKPLLAESFSKQIENWNKKRAEDNLVKSSINKYRNQLGLLDLFSTSVSLGLGEDSLFKVVKEVYPRSLRINNLVLARTEKSNSIFESTIYRQLLVSPQIPLIEIKVGIDRVAKYRDQELIGHPSDLLGLIIALAGDPCSKTNLEKHLVSGSGLSNLEQWLVELFKESKIGLLHRDEVVEAAIEAGVAIGSITQYLSTTPIVRAHGKGIYSLVNQSISKIDIETYIDEFSKTSKRIIHKLVFDSGVTYFHIVPNLGLLAGGALIANNQEKEFFANSIFSVACSCSDFSSRQKVRVTTDGFLIGLTSLLHHSIQHHHFSSDAPLKMTVDKLNLLIRLEVD